jgi:hypothetical protein
MENKITQAGNRMAEKYLMPTYHKGDFIAVPSWKKEGVYVLPGNIETSADELVVNGFTPKITPLWSRFWIEVRT